MNKDEKELIGRCVESHREMVMYNRRQVIELSRKKIAEPELCMECFDMKVIDNETPA